MVVRLVGAATLVDGRWDVRVGPALVDREPPARRRRGRVQRGDAAGRRDPRDHARGARARAGSRPPRPWSRTWSRSSARPAPAFSRTTRAGATLAAASGRRGGLAVLRPRRGRRPAGRARARRARGSPRTGSRSRGSSSGRERAARRCTSSPTRRPPGGCATRSTRSTRSTRRARLASALAGDLRPRRRGARMEMTRLDGAQAPASPAPGSGHDRHARRGQHAAPAGAAALGAARLRALAEVGGREPDRELQGPRHGASRSVARRSSAARRASSAPRRATPPRRPPPTPRAPGCRRSIADPEGRSRAREARRRCSPPAPSSARWRARSRTRTRSPVAWPTRRAG